jgi:hypothetical protein
VKDVKPAADFIVAHGPVTNQDRWEEKSGYSPATIAAEIAGLVCAAEIARRNRDNASAVRYLKTSDGWKSALTTWTVTSNGPHGDRKYFLRLTEKGNPNDGDVMDINSGGGKFDQRSIVDPGFPSWCDFNQTRNELPIVNSLKIDSLIRQTLLSVRGGTATTTTLTGSEQTASLTTGRVALVVSGLCLLANVVNTNLPQVEMTKLSRCLMRWRDLPMPAE